MKILLLGKSGMLGSCFMDLFVGTNGYQLYAFGHEDFDVCDEEKLAMEFEKIQPDLVLNCSGYTAVDKAENEQNLAFKINAEAVKKIAEQCKKIGATLIHFSTDYVFDGKKVAGYAEDDKTDPINVYGSSKLAGEKFIQENMEKYYIVRTSWLFGPHGKNFVDTMIKLGEESIKNGTELKVVQDQIGSPTYTYDLAGAVISHFVNDTKNPFGIYHLTNSQTCSWFDFAKKIFEIKNLAVKLLPVTSDQFPRPAKRPAFSILLNSKLPQLRAWTEAVRAYIARY